MDKEERSTLRLPSQCVVRVGPRRAWRALNGAFAWRSVRKSNAVDTGSSRSSSAVWNETGGGGHRGSRRDKSAVNKVMLLVGRQKRQSPAEKRDQQCTPRLWCHCLITIVERGDRRADTRYCEKERWASSESGRFGGRPV